MIGIFKQDIQQIPCLFVVEEKKAKEPLPVVVYFHGFTSAKEHNLDTAYMLAERGFRVVLPDSLHHGERENGISSSDRMLAFWEIVLENIKELAFIKTFLDEKGLILAENIAIAGTSMGGITTSASLTEYPWIKAAAVMMGTPKITKYFQELIQQTQKTMKIPYTKEEIQGIEDKLQQYDLSLHMEKLKNRPLMFWHGDKDPTVPIQFTYPFFEEAKKYYEQTDRIHFITEKGKGHKVSRNGKLACVEWFEKYMSDANHLKEA